MNDAKCLYVAVSYHGDDDFSEKDGFDLVFDNDHGSETTIEEGDEILSVWGTSNFQDEFWHYEKIGGYDWHAMIDTPEGYAAGNRQGTLNEFELSNPLNSGEIGKDLSLSSGQIVGFSLRVHVDDFYNVCDAVPEWNNPSAYANYVVASPAVLTPTVDMTVVTTSMPITVTTQTASAGRTTVEPVLESSSSSRSTILGVIMGLLVSIPISVYRHTRGKRSTGPTGMWRQVKQLGIRRYPLLREGKAILVLLVACNGPFLVAGLVFGSFGPLLEPRALLSFGSSLVIVSSCCFATIEISYRLVRRFRSYVWALLAGMVLASLAIVMSFAVQYVIYGFSFETFLVQLLFYALNLQFADARHPAIYLYLTLVAMMLSSLAAPKILQRRR
jgi:hypothetical protein